MHPKRSFTSVAVFGLVTLAALAASSFRNPAGDKKVKPERSVVLAKSWEGAVREAKLLKLPIVVHNHGFY
ncbi:MAG TPA: hypothetical protein ENK02_10875 [Planctomycetes bacterium]|nr:hypothetical protein [Planctomycetota bacterium]